MIQNIKKGRGFKGAIAYVIEKEGAKILGGTMVGRDTKSLTREASRVRTLNTALGRAVFHASLSLSKGESLEETQWSEIAKKYMDGMGFEDSPYLITRHTDSDSDHIHIVALRIDTKTKKTVKDSKDFERGAKIIQQIELDYGLKKGAQTPSQARKKAVKDIKRGEIEKSLRTGEAPARLLLRSYIDEATKDKPSIFEFVDRLESAGVEVYPSVASTGRMNGFKFKVDSIYFKASDLGKSYGWKKLSERVIYDQSTESAGLIELAKNARYREDKDDKRAISTDRKVSGRHNENNGGEQGDFTPDSAKYGAGNDKNTATNGENNDFHNRDTKGVRATANRDKPRLEEHQGGNGGSQRDDKQQTNNNSVDSVLDDIRYSGDSVANLSAPIVKRGDRPSKMVSVDNTRKQGYTEKELLAPDHIKKIAAWQRQHQALDAEAYRITIVPRRDDTKRIFNFGKSRTGGEEKFYSAKEVEALIPQLRRQNALGADIYITPIDTKSHFILLDDSTQEQVKELKSKSGFTPSLIQQSSAGNVQAIYKVTKKVSESEQSTANKLMRSINQKYGDKKISGVIHPFRMAGFSNAKPKREVDGKRPFIKIIEINTNDNEKMEEWLQTLREKDEQIKLEKERSRRNAILSVDNDKNVNVDSELNYTSDKLKNYQSTYRKEYNRTIGLVKSMGWELDMSRVDFKISQQMIKQGYSEKDVESAIVDCSPMLCDRHSEATVYARRTVQAALLSDDVQKHQQRSGMGM